MFSNLSITTNSNYYILLVHLSFKKKQKRNNKKKTVKDTSLLIIKLNLFIALLINKLNFLKILTNFGIPISFLKLQAALLFCSIQKHEVP